MPFNGSKRNRQPTSYPFKIFLLASTWLVVIAALHQWLNTESDERKTIRMGYMPVITNLAAPLLDHASAESDAKIRFKALKFASFAEMAEALRNNEIQAGFIIAPLSIVLRQQGEDVKVVSIGNRHESTLVVHKDIGAKSLADLAGKTIAVPMRYSGHNLGILKAISDAGLDGRINIVEMNPPDMASALSSGALDAYFVGEPFAAQTLKTGTSELLFYAEKIWPGFICNLILVRQQLIEQEEESVRYLVEGAIRSGLWAQRNPSEAAKIASRYWGQPIDLVEYAMSTPKGRIVYDRYIPIREELQQMADLMVQFNLSASADIQGLVEDRFARNADIKGISDLASILGE